VMPNQISTKPAGTMKNVKRFLLAIFGAFIFPIVVPIAYFFAFDKLPSDGCRGVALLAGVGAILGAFLGALFSRVFGFVVESFSMSEPLMLCHANRMGLGRADQQRPCTRSWPLQIVPSGTGLIQLAPIRCRPSRLDPTALGNVPGRCGVLSEPMGICVSNLGLLPGLVGAMGSVPYLRHCVQMAAAAGSRR